MRLDGCVPPPPAPQRRPPRHDAPQSVVRVVEPARGLSETRVGPSPRLSHSRPRSESSDESESVVQTRNAALRGRLGVEFREDEHAPKTAIAKISKGKARNKHTWEREWWWQESAWDERGDIKASGSPKVDDSSFSDEQVDDLLHDKLAEHNLGGKIRTWLHQRPKLVLVHLAHLDLKEHAPVKDHTVMKCTNDIIAWLWDQDTDRLVRAFQDKHALSEESLGKLRQADRWVQLAVMGGSWHPGILDKSAALLQELDDLEALSNQVDWRQRPKVRIRCSASGRSPSPAHLRRTPSPLRGRPSESEAESLSDSSDEEVAGQRSFASPASSVNSPRGERARNLAGSCSAGFVGVLKTTGFVYGFIACDEAQAKYSRDVFVFYKTNPDVFGKPCNTLVEFGMYEHWRRGVIAVDAVEFDLDSFIYAASLKISLSSSLRSMKPESQASLLNRVTKACNTWGPPSSMARLVVQQMREVKEERRRNAKRQLMPPPLPRRIPRVSAQRPSKRLRTRESPSQSPTERIPSRSDWPSATRDILPCQDAELDWRRTSVEPSKCTLTPTPEPEASSGTASAGPHSGEQSRAEAAARDMLTRKARDMEAKLRKVEALRAGRDKVSIRIPNRRIPLPVERLMSGIEPTPVASPPDDLTKEAVPETREAAEAAAKDLLALRANEMEARLLQLRSAPPLSITDANAEISMSCEHSTHSATPVALYTLTPAAVDSPGASQQQEEEEEEEEEEEALDIAEEDEGIIEEDLMLEKNVLEVLGLNGSFCMNGPSPGALISETLNGALSDLPWYQADVGPPVLRSWISDSGDLRMELQSTRLCTSALRVLDGLKVHDRQVHARIV